MTKIEQTLADLLEKLTAATEDELASDTDPKRKAYVKHAIPGILDQIREVERRIREGDYNADLKPTVKQPARIDEQ